MAEDLKTTADWRLVRYAILGGVAGAFAGPVFAVLLCAWISWLAGVTFEPSALAFFEAVIALPAAIGGAVVSGRTANG